MKTEMYSFENVTKILNDVNEMVYGIRPFDVAKKACPHCNGTGTTYESDGHDDVNAEVCECVKHD